MLHTMKQGRAKAMKRGPDIFLWMLVLAILVLLLRVAAGLYVKTTSFTGEIPMAVHNPVGEQQG